MTRGGGGGVAPAVSLDPPQRVLALHAGHRVCCHCHWYSTAVGGDWSEVINIMSATLTHSLAHSLTHSLS